MDFRVLSADTHQSSDPRVRGATVCFGLVDAGYKAPPSVCATAGATRTGRPEAHTNDTRLFDGLWGETLTYPDTCIPLL